MKYRDTTPAVVGDIAQHPPGSPEWVGAFWDRCLHAIFHELQALELDGRMSSDEAWVIRTRLDEAKVRAVHEARMTDAEAAKADAVDDADELPEDYAQDGPA